MAGMRCVRNQFGTACQHTRCPDLYVGTPNGKEVILLAEKCGDGRALRFLASPTTSSARHILVRTSVRLAQERLYLEAGFQSNLYAAVQSTRAVNAGHPMLGDDLRIINSFFQIH
jgi:hypothetical protein